MGDGYNNCGTGGGIFGGNGLFGNGWEWIIIVVVVILIFFPGIFGGLGFGRDNNCCCDPK